MVLLAFGLFFYFLLIPSRLNPEVYDSWVPSLLFFTGLDFVLALMFMRLTISAKTQRWKVLYSLLAAANFLFAILDLLEGMDYSWVYDWARSAASDTIWSVPFLLMVIVARARHFEYSEPVGEMDGEHVAQEFLGTNISPVIMVSFVLPLLHIRLDQLGLLREAMRGAQTTVVLGSLVIFWILAIWENISLRVISQNARAQSVELEELRIKQAVAEEAERVKGRFLANVSHEIRTPMNGILGMSEILLRGELNSEQKQGNSRSSRSLSDWTNWLNRCSIFIVLLRIQKTWR